MTSLEVPRAEREIHMNEEDREVRTVPVGLTVRRPERRTKR